MSWGWAPVGGPTAGEAGREGDGESWLWKVQARGQEPRTIEVRLSETLVRWVNRPEVTPDLREAVLTKGRSELIRVALWETPPILIEVDTAAWRPGGSVVNPR